MKNLVPAKGYLLTQLVKNKTTTSGLVLPDTAQYSGAATVLLSQSEKYPNPKAVYFKGQSHAVKNEDGEFVLVHEDDVIAILE